MIDHDENRKPLSATQVAKICKKEGITLKEFYNRDSHNDISIEKQRKKSKKRERVEERAQKNLEKFIR